MSSGPGDERPPSGDAELVARLGRVVLRARFRDCGRVRASRDRQCGRRLPRARGRHPPARLHERPALRQRRAPQRADPGRDRGGARPVRVRMGRLGDGVPLTRREADRRRPAGTRRLGGPDQVHVVGVGGGRARAPHREDRYRPTERDLPRLRLPRLDARRALAHGTARLAGHPRRGRLRRGSAPAGHPDAGRALRTRALLLRLSDRAHLSRVQAPRRHARVHRGDRASDPHHRARLDRGRRCRADLRRRACSIRLPSTCRSCAS